MSDFDDFKEALDASAQYLQEMLDERKRGCLSDEAFGRVQADAGRLASALENFQEWMRECGEAVKKLTSREYDSRQYQAALDLASSRYDEKEAARDREYPVLGSDDESDPADWWKSGSEEER